MITACERFGSAYKQRQRCRLLAYRLDAVEVLLDKLPGLLRADCHWREMILICSRAGNPVSKMVRTAMDVREKEDNHPRFDT